MVANGERSRECNFDGLDVLEGSVAKRPAKLDDRRGLSDPKIMRSCVEILSHHEVKVSSLLDDPTKPALGADPVADIVVLDEAFPGQLRREVQLHPNPSQSGRKIRLSNRLLSRNRMRLAIEGFVERIECTAAGTDPEKPTLVVVDREQEMWPGTPRESRRDAHGGSVVEGSVAHKNAAL